MKTSHKIQTLHLDENGQTIGLEMIRSYENGPEIKLINTILDKEEVENLVHSLCLSIGVKSPIMHREI